MKSMALLIDTNVVLDYLLEREPQYEHSEPVLNFCRTSLIKGYVAFHTLPSIWYIMRKYAIPNRREALLEITYFLTVVSAPHEKVIDAIKQENFSDFEDCLQEKCAEEINADYIVTNNVKNFSASKIPALSPREILETIFEIKFNELNNL